ncbi:MAG: MarR family transcriptional regulator [Thermotogae bacterium]|nr:MarR family transcriptional regulator [Thermotogota bacterium]
MCEEKTVDLEKLVGGIKKFMQSVVGEVFKGDARASRYIALFTLHRYGAVNISQLAQKAHFSKPTFSLLMKQLEREGLVRRVRDSSDKRISVIELTEEGARYVKAMKRELQSRLEKLLESLDTLEKQKLLEAVKTLEIIAEKFRKRREANHGDDRGQGS